jgi:hypothetical protein
VVLLESSSEDAATVVEIVAVSDVATSVASVASSSSGAGVRSSAVGGPSVTLIVGDGCSGSSAPSTMGSIHAVSPCSHVWITGKLMPPAVSGAVKVMSK